MSEPPLLHDRYRILERLGRGAFATVYLAEDLTMGRRVAVKVVEDSRDLDGRVLREARAAAKLSHPHILHVYEVVQETDRTLLFMEYVQGETLRSLYAKRRLSDKDVLEAGTQICRALEHGHKRGVVHRDIKPENVMLLEAEEVDARVMDFGVARLEDHTAITMEGDLVGTLAYMAPEQLAGRDVDAKADVYALGLTLYEGLTGLNPLRGKDVGELLRASGERRVPRLRKARPDLPEELEAVLDAALHPEPQARLDAVGLRRGLEKALRKVPEAPAAEPTLPTRVRSTVGSVVSPVRLGPRAGYMARRLTAALLALVSLAYVLPGTGIYAADLTFALVAGTAFLALLWPFGGGLVALGLMAPPAFVFGMGWGLLYVATALPLFLFLKWRRREWAALLPAAAPALVAGGVGLALPPLAGLLLRRWGALVAFICGLTLAVAAGLAGWATLPYTFSPDPGPVLLEGRYAENPLVALEYLARFLDLRPELLLQSALFGAFALPLSLLLSLGGRRRIWATAVYLGLLFVAFVAAPPLLLGVSVALGPFFIAYVPCVILVTLFSLLFPREESNSSAEH